GSCSIQYADAYQAIHQDRVLRHQRFVFIHAFWEHLEEVAYCSFKLHRHIAPQPTRADVGGHHPLARTQLEDIQNILALTETIEEDRHGSQVETKGSEPDQMGGDAL